MPDDQRRPHVQRTSQVLGSKSTICTLKGENPKKLKITAQYK